MRFIQSIKLGAHSNQFIHMKRNTMHAIRLKRFHFTFFFFFCFFFFLLLLSLLLLHFALVFLSSIARNMQCSGYASFNGEEDALTLTDFTLCYFFFFLVFILFLSLFLVAVIFLTSAKFAYKPIHQLLFFCST